ncbi:MAG: hypothetical protein WA792_07310 [Pseudolabrys sp.]
MDKRSGKSLKQRVEDQREESKERGDEVEVSSDDSFPASDAPSFTPVQGSKTNDIDKKR